MIIAYLLFVSCGCGYKAAPYYSDVIDDDIKIVADSANLAQTKENNEI